MPFSRMEARLKVKPGECLDRANYYDSPMIQCITKEQCRLMDLMLIQTKLKPKQKYIHSASADHPSDSSFFPSIDLTFFTHLPLEIQAIGLTFYDKICRSNHLKTLTRGAECMICKDPNNN
jgi:hypothetical protein